MSNALNFGSCYAKAVLSIPLVVCAATSSLAADEVKLRPAKDTTIYQDSNGSLSSGQGMYMFAGINGPGGGHKIMRSLLAFDLSSIPPGSKIEHVSLMLYQSTPRSDATQRTVTLHRVERDWGQGASDADGDSSGSGGADGAPAQEGDATWLHAFFNNEMWTDPGGDFDNTASASQSVGGNGYYQWDSTSDLVSDVQKWVDDPSSNFGWLLKGQESLNGAGFTTRRFSTREAVSENRKPELTVVYTANQRPDFVFPQFVSGEGNSTRWILRNNSLLPATGHVGFLDAAGASTQIMVNGALTDQVDFSLDPWGSSSFSTDTTGALRSGAAEVYVETGSGADLEAAQVFLLLGRYVSVTGARPEKQWQAYVSRNEVENAGIAVQNPDRGESAILKLILVNSTGSEIAADTMTLNPGQRVAQFLGESLLFKDYFEQNPGNFEGTLNIHVTEGKDIAVVGLIQKRPGGDLIAVEATNKAFTGTPQ